MSHPWSLAGHAPTTALAAQGFALLAPSELQRLTTVPPAVLVDWWPLWERLAPDEYLRDGGSYRSRRHGSFVHEVGRNELTLSPHRPHWQSTDYNALHGGT